MSLFAGILVRKSKERALYLGYRVYSDWNGYSKVRSETCIEHAFGSLEKFFGLARQDRKVRWEKVEN